MRARLVVRELPVQGLFAISASRPWVARLNLPISVQSTSQFKLNSQALAAPDPDTWTVVVTTADRAGTGNLPCRETKLPCKDPYDELSDGDRCQFGRSRDSPRNIERQPALLTQPPAEMRLGSLEEVP